MLVVYKPPSNTHPWKWSHKRVNLRTALRLKRRILVLGRKSPGSRGLMMLAMHLPRQFQTRTTCCKLSATLVQADQAVTHLAHVTQCVCPMAKMLDPQKKLCRRSLLHAPPPQAPWLGNQTKRPRGWAKKGGLLPTLALGLAQGADFVHHRRAGVGILFCGFAHRASVKSPQGWASPLWFVPLNGQPEVEYPQVVWPPCLNMLQAPCKGQIICATLSERINLGWFKPKSKSLPSHGSSSP